MPETGRGRSCKECRCDVWTRPRPNASIRPSITEAFAGISGEVADVGTAARRAEDEEADLQARAAARDDLLTADARAIVAPTLSDEQLQAQLDQISMRAEVDKELTRLSERLASGARPGHRSVRHTADLRVEGMGADTGGVPGRGGMRTGGQFRGRRGHPAPAHSRAALHRGLGCGPAGSGHR